MMLFSHFFSFLRKIRLTFRWKHRYCYTLNVPPHTEAGYDHHTVHPDNTFTTLRERDRHLKWRCGRGPQPGCKNKNPHLTNCVGLTAQQHQQTTYCWTPHE